VAGTIIPTVTRVALRRQLFVGHPAMDLSERFAD
jgi:hypothetical protein